MDRPKVFGIGLHKSGTSSLASALFALGHRVGGYDSHTVDFDRLASLDREAGRSYVWDHLHPSVPLVDAMQDTPWWLFFRELDERFPGSKFILTTRERERWLSSVQTHFGTGSNRWDDWIFEGRNSVDDPQVFLDCYDEHHAAVADWFADRPDSLLEIGISAGLTWEPLCNFLGLDTPTYPFPRSNPGDARSATFAARAKRRLKRMYQARFGSGSDVIRTIALYTACDDETKRVRRLVAERGAETGALSDAVLPLIIELKTHLGIPYDPAGPGVDGDDADATWRRLEFELRHSIGQISELGVDDSVGDRTVEGLSREILQTVGRFDG